MSELPERADDVQAFMDGLTFEVGTATTPPKAGDQVMVVRSLRLPVDLDQQLKRVATDRGIAMSTLVREWIEMELAVLEQDQPISRADAMRALSTLRPLGRPA
jgi:predicted DNA-binding protein